MILRLGIGEDAPKQDGYQNVDIRPLPNIDVVADASKLPHYNNSVAGIETRNLVEHFGRHEIDALFKEWARVLKKGGSLFIETVDMGETMTHWQDIPTENLLDGILGAQTYPENFHKMAFTRPLLEKKLKDAGFEIVQVWQFLHRLIPRIQVKAKKL